MTGVIKIVVCASCLCDGVYKRALAANCSGGRGFPL